MHMKGGVGGCRRCSGGGEKLAGGGGVFGVRRRVCTDGVMGVGVGGEGGVDGFLRRRIKLWLGKFCLWVCILE